MEAAIQNKFLKLIDFAMRNHWVIQLKHKNSWRTVEPYIAGVHQTTHSASLYGYCRDVVPSPKEGNTRWQVFSLNEVEDVELTFYEFSTRYDYGGTFEPIHPVYFKVD
ncbi:hypothetical protein [Spirosoma fluminis]